MRSGFRFSSLCAISLIVPSLAFSSNYWFASSPTQTNSSIKKSSSKTTNASIAPKTPSKEFWEAALMLGAGYRNDTIKASAKPPKFPLSEQNFFMKYKDLNSVMEVLKFEARVWNFLFDLEGDYAPLVSGKQSSDFISRDGPQNTFRYKYHKLSGYAADALGSIGYRLECNPNSNFIFAIIPQVGYSYSHQSYEMDSRSKYTNTVSNPPLVTFLQDQGPFQQDWFGPYLEAKFSLSYKGKVFLQPFYQYHWLDYRSVKYFTFSAPAASAEFTWRGAIKSDSAWGQTAGADFFYQSMNRWRIGWKGYWNGFNSGKAKCLPDRTFTSYTTNPPSVIRDTLKEKIRTHWNNYSIYMYAGYDF